MFNFTASDFALEQKFHIAFVYYYETYRQIRKIPRLQSAQINFNNWFVKKLDNNVVLNAQCDNK